MRQILTLCYAGITQPSDNSAIDSELKAYASRRDWRRHLETLFFKMPQSEKIRAY